MLNSQVPKPSLGPLFKGNSLFTLTSMVMSSIIIEVIHMHFFGNEAVLITHWTSKYIVSIANKDFQMYIQPSVSPSQFSKVHLRFKSAMGLALRLLIAMLRFIQLPLRLLSAAL